MQPLTEPVLGRLAIETQSLCEVNDEITRGRELDTASERSRALWRVIRSVGRERHVVICIATRWTTWVTPGAAHAAFVASSIDCQDDA